MQDPRIIMRSNCTYKYTKKLGGYVVGCRVHECRDDPLHESEPLGLGLRDRLAFGCWGKWAQALAGACAFKAESFRLLGFGEQQFRGLGFGALRKFIKVYLELYMSLTSLYRCGGWMNLSG